MTRRAKVEVAALGAGGTIAAVLYSNFVLDWTRRGFIGMDDIVSQLEAPGEPHAMLLRVTDVVCAVLVVALLPRVRAGLPRGPWRELSVWATVGFALGASLAALVPPPCGPDVVCTGARLQIAVHDISSIASDAALYVGVVAAWLATRGRDPAWLHRAAAWVFWIGGVGTSAVFAWFNATDDPEWAAGLSQRAHIVCISLWLLCLTVLAARSRTTRPSTASIATAISPRSTTMSTVADHPEILRTQKSDRAARKATAPHSEPAGERWPDRIAGVVLLAAALVAVVAAVPSWRSFFMAPDDSLSLLTIPVVPSLVYAAVLLVVGVAVRRRLRAAWWIVLVWWLVVPDVGRVATIARGEHVALAAVGLVVGAVALALMVCARPGFVARHAAVNTAAAVGVLVLGGGVVLIGGAALISAVGTSPGLGSSAAYVWGTILTDIGRLDTHAAVHVPWAVRMLIDAAGAGVVLTTAVLLFRAPRDRRELHVADEAQVRTLLRDFGDLDSLGYFATRRDKSVIWDTDAAGAARAGVSYRVIGSVSLASGNPVGDPERWTSAIGKWRDDARAHGWSLAVIGAGIEGAHAFAEAGLTMLEIGDEAVVDMRKFTLNGPGMNRVRQSVTRLRRRGYTTRVVRHATLSQADFAELEEAAGHWRGDGGDERGFSMALGRLADPLDGGCVLVEARDAEGRLRGFLSLVPWGRTGLSLDLMRRDPSADNGLVELMVASLAAQAPTLGVGPVSLNFAMFREAFERGAEIGAGPIARLWRRGLLLASKAWQLESLYRSNAKYLPDWRPRFLGFEHASDLPRVGTAAGSAEGFLALPHLGRSGATNGEFDRADLAHGAAVLALVPPPRDVVAEAVSPDHLPQQMKVRRAKLDQLRERGIDPYPATAPRTHTLAQVRSEFADLAADAETGVTVSVTGRVLLKRDMGGLGFAKLRDGSGDLQVMVDAQHLDADALSFWEHDVDLGDHVAVTGEVVATHKGELSVRAASVLLTSKALRPLPDKHKGLADPDARVRARYVDLIMRPDARSTAYQRATVVRSVRDSLHARGFTEVETPVLQTIHGGANARPFETHINAYDLDMYLRIATELHLKRLVVGGMERIFEIGRQFRNEGADFKHNPEFTSLELYETYGDYETMRVLTQEVIQEAATAVYGAPVARRRDASGAMVEHDLSGDWPVKTICQAVSEVLGEEVTADTPLAELVRHAERIGLELDLEPSWGPVLEAIYEELCEGQTTTPVFYTDFPKENAPLTRAHRRDPRLAEKWDLVMFGAEQGTAYSELVDPVDQRERLVAQSLLAAAGDAEAMQVDEDFLQALEYGMPPTGGMGLGIDRLVMNLTGLSIRDTILFPLVKPR